ncbi:hypothetical protein [Streptomyces sp. NPDC051993]|uniref:class I SAM-dependent methyltransferase n=1 Tax=Streptomyces sp. NPDC051993 TaxID=3155286 RepID=UPI0034368538
MPQDRAGERPGSGSGGAWSGREGAEAFAAVDAATDWLLGYPFVFRALGAGSGTDRVLLDFGCGPGRVADRAARRLGGSAYGSSATRGRPQRSEPSWNARGSRRPHSTIRHLTRRRASPTRTTCAAATGPPNGGAHRWW